MKKSSKNNLLSVREDKSILAWSILCFVLIFIFIAPFKAALFNGGQPSFERPIYTAVVWCSVILLLISIYFFYRWRLDDQRDLLSLLVWFIPLSYLISSFNAASPHSAVDGIYISVLYATFFLIGINFSENKLYASILQYGIILSGYMLVIYGYMNWLGNVEFKDAVLGNRLSNVFQYPNTYAAYLIPIYFGSLLFVNTSKKWYGVFLHSIMLVPISLSLLLTLSRGGLLVLTILFVIFLVFFPWYKQILTLIYFGGSLIVSLFLLQEFTTLRVSLNKENANSLSVKGWAILLTTSIIISLIIWFSKKYLEPRLKMKFNSQSKFNFKNFIIPFLLIIVGVAGFYLLFFNESVNDKLPTVLQQRIENVNSESISVASRTAFFKDSIKLFKDHPYLGAGGGAWSSLYNEYKSYPYTSRQAHNFLLQYLVEVGLVGTIIFMLFFGIILFYYIKDFVRHYQTGSDSRSFIFFIIVISIFGHSMIDFDMSFVYLAALFFLSLGGMASSLHTADNPLLSLFKSREWPKWSGKLYPAVLSVLAIVMFTVSVQASRASSLFANAVQEANTTRNYNNIIQPLDSALKLRTHHPDYTFFKIDLLKGLYQQTKDEKYYREAMGLVQQLKQEEAHNLQLLEEEYALYIIKGNLDQALELITKGLNQYPWEISFYERIVALNFDLGNQARQQNDKGKMDEYWNKALDTYKEVAQKREIINESPKYIQSASGSFKITQSIALSIGQIHYLRGEYPIAFSIFKLAHTSNDFNVTINKVTARWYLAALQSQDQNNELLYDMLIKADPNEAEKIQAILNINR